MTATVSIALGSTASALAASSLPSTDPAMIPVVAESKADVTKARPEQGAPLLESLTLTVKASELAERYDPMELAGWVPHLQPGGTVTVRVCVDSPTSSNDDPQRNSSSSSLASVLQPVHTSFLLAGLQGVTEKRESIETRDDEMENAGGKAHRQYVVAVLSASRAKSIRSGNAGKGVLAAPISLKKDRKALSGTSKIVVNLDDDDDVDGSGGVNELIDEDALLDNDGLLNAPPAMGTRSTNNSDDCGGRKACDNCTCGRAEAERAVAGGAPMEHGQQAVKTSACGNCGKGDAFRCASCPYLGKPAFKAGEEHLVLDLTDDL